MMGTNNYAIAYADKNGKDFFGLPWILDDIDGLDDCIAHSEKMRMEGFQNVIPFQYDGKGRNTEEEFTWCYVKNHKL